MVSPMTGMVIVMTCVTMFQVGVTTEGQKTLLLRGVKPSVLTGRRSGVVISRHTREPWAYRDEPGSSP